MKTMWRKDETDYQTIALSVLAGAAAGLVVGLLLAPKSGEELRDEIGSAVDDYMDSARQKAGDLRASAGDLASRGLEEVRHAKDVVAEKVSSVVDRGEKDALQAIDDATTNVESSAKKKGQDAVHQAASAARAGVRS